MRENTTSVPHQAGRMADLIGRTTPLPAVPRGRHRGPRTPLDAELLLTTLALGAMFAAAIYTIGGPW